MLTEKMQMIIEYRDILLEVKELESEILGLAAVTKAIEQKLPDLKQKKPEEPKKHHRGRAKKVDRGKVLALARAGWKNADIARDVKCSEWTVNKILKEAREEGIL